MIPPNMPAKKPAINPLPAPFAINPATIPPIKPPIRCPIPGNRIPRTRTTKKPTKAPNHILPKLFTTFTNESQLVTKAKMDCLDNALLV